MDVLKERKKSPLLEGLESLNSRFDLPLDVLRYYRALESGLEGEKIYDRLMDEIVEGDSIILNDLLLKINGSTIQIDSLVLTPEMIYLIEVKNYNGRYQFENDQYKKLSGLPIPNPKDQLNKAMTLMSQLLNQWKVSTPLSGAVIFVDPTFILYGALKDEQIVHPPQIPAYLSGLNSQKNTMPHHMRMLANRLIEQHMHEAPYQTQLPPFEWDELKKGLTCGSCKSFDLILTQRTCTCRGCLLKTTRQENFLSNINELKLLYPSSKLTTQLIYDWFGKEVSKDTIKNSLLKHYKSNGTAKARYYE